MIKTKNPDILLSFVEEKADSGDRMGALGVKTLNIDAVSYTHLDVYKRQSYICADSVLRHLHCGSGTEWSYSFTYHVLRNRMLMIYKCAWFGAFIKNYLSFAASAFIGLAYGIILKIRKISSSRPDVPIRIRILFEFFILFFRKLPERIKIRKNKIISDDEIIKWLNDF